MLEGREEMRDLEIGEGLGLRSGGSLPGGLGGRGGGGALGRERRNHGGRTAIYHCEIRTPERDRALNFSEALIFFIFYF